MTIITAELKQTIATKAVKECPVCHGYGSIYYRKLEDHLNNTEGEWSFICCQSCGTLWLDPRPLPSELSKIYCDYFTHGEFDPSFNLPNNSGINLKERMKELLLPRRYYELSAIRSMFLKNDPPGRLLDVGCGNGRFLAYMRNLGWDVIGVEPDIKAAQIAAKQFHLKIYTDTLENLDFASDSFDAITLSHVIEHVPNPSDLLIRCRKFLREKGLLAILTPNIDSLGHIHFRRSWFALEPPRHFVLFNREGLEKLLEANGFRTKQSATFSRMVSGIYTLSSNISRSGNASNKQATRWSEKYLRMFFVFTEYWLNLISGNKGEEIGILAEKY